jgi:N-hydroxyarylamine O-acetyltransferase
MNVPAYLDRIGYRGPTELTSETLRLLHRSHLETVPFENLDISRSRPIVLDENTIVHKIVAEHRGGFCYELNDAFAALLRALGFQVTLLSCRVARENGTESPDFDHLALRVDLEQTWLGDVGFGEGFLEPLLVQRDVEQKQEVGVYRIAETHGSLTVERQQPDLSWKTEYRFTLTPRRMKDFTAMCHFHQTSPDSHFTQKRICSLAVPNGRITLADLKLITTKNGIRQERILASEEERRAVFRAVLWYCVVISFNMTGL